MSSDLIHTVMYSVTIIYTKYFFCNRVVSVCQIYNVVCGMLTLETIVFLFHLLSATSKPFSSLSTRLAHAARFFTKTHYKNSLLLLLLLLLFEVRRNRPTVRDVFPSVLWRCWLDFKEGHPACKKTGCWFVGGWRFAHFIAPVVTTTSIILSCSETGKSRSTWKSGVKTKRDVYMTGTRCTSWHNLRQFLSNCHRQQFLWLFWNFS